MSSRGRPAVPPPPPPGHRAGWIVVAALFTPLVLLLLVAALTWRSERRMAVVTDRVVHDYAAIAVWQYARRASGVLHDETMHAFAGAPPGGHVRSGAQTTLAPPATILAGRGAGSSVFLAHAELALAYDPATDRLETAVAGDTAAGARTVAMLRRRLRAAVRDRSVGDEPHRVLFDSADGRSYAIALALVRRRDETAPLVQALVIDAAALAPVFHGIARDAELLPAVAGRRALESTELALRLTRPDGAVVFATTHPLGPTMASDTTGVQGGALHAALDLPPALARELLVGSAPRSQLPSLALMLVAAGALAIVGLVHHRRSRALAEARTRFVANVSHELRTPLAQISMFAETLHLGRERSDAERRQFARIMFAEARRLTALIENVLRFSRSEHGAVALSCARHALGEIVANAVRTFAPIAADADAVVDVDAEDVDATVDPVALHQVVLNLLDNAVKHGGRGVRVLVTLRPRGDEATLTVDDSGPGIPRAHREHVFAPFAQLAGRNVAGAGIGLAIVRDVVLAHGGRVGIDDSPLGGARVTIAIPAHTPAMQSVQSHPASAAR